MRSVDAAELWRRIIESGKTQPVFLNDKDTLRVSVIPVDELFKIVVNCIDDMRKDF